MLLCFTSEFDCGVGHLVLFCFTSQFDCRVGHLLFTYELTCFTSEFDCRVGHLVLFFLHLSLTVGLDTWCVLFYI